MKHASLLLIIVLAGLFAAAQQTLTIPYQALVRDANGNPVTNQQIGAKITLLQDSIAGQEVFSETHAAFTNAFGQMELQIGSVETAVFDAIDWSAGKMFIRLEVDITGGTEYQTIATHQLLAVPYAKYAEEAAGWKKNETGISFMDGNVGIGVDSAINNLDINGTLGVSRINSFNYQDGDNFIGIHGTTGTNQWLRFRLGGNSPVGYAGIVFSRYDTNHSFIFRSSDGLKISTSTEVSEFPNFENSVEQFTIKDNGYVGIRTSSPESSLHIGQGSLWITGGSGGPGTGSHKTSQSG